MGVGKKILWFDRGEMEYTIWLFQQFAMERSTIFKFRKPSISMGHLYHGELLVITRG